MKLSRTPVVALCLSSSVSVAALGGRFGRGYNYNVSSSSITSQQLSTSVSPSMSTSASTSILAISLSTTAVQSSSSLTSSLSLPTTSAPSNETIPKSASLPNSGASTSSVNISTTHHVTASPMSLTTTLLSSTITSSTSIVLSSPSSSLTSRPVNAQNPSTSTSAFLLASTTPTVSANSTHPGASLTAPVVSHPLRSNSSVSASSTLFDLGKTLQPSGSFHLKPTSPYQNGEQRTNSSEHGNPATNSSQHGDPYRHGAQSRRPTATGAHQPDFTFGLDNGTDIPYTGNGTGKGPKYPSKPVKHLTSDGVLDDGQGYQTPPPASETMGPMKGLINVKPFFKPAVMEVSGVLYLEGPSFSTSSPSSETILVASPLGLAASNPLSALFASLYLEASLTEKGTANAVGVKALTSATSLGGLNAIQNQAIPMAGNGPSINLGVVPTAAKQEMNAQSTNKPANGGTPDAVGLGNLAIGLLSAAASNVAASPAVAIPVNQVAPTSTPQPQIAPVTQAGDNSAIQQEASSKNGQAVSPNSPGPQPSVPAVVVQSQTIAQGAPPVTINGNTVAYSAGSIYVGNSAGPAPVPQQANQNSNPAPVDLAGYRFTPVQVNNQVVTAAPAVVVQGQTLSQNAPPVSISGVPLAYSAGSVYAGSSAAPVPPPAPAQQTNQAPPPVTFAGYQFTPIQQQDTSNGPVAPAVVVQGQTLSQNAPPVSIAGTPVAYSAGSVFVGSNAAPVPTVVPQQPNVVNAPPPVTLGGYTFVPTSQQNGQGGAPAGAVVVQGQTLSANAAPITVSGVPLAYSGGSVFVGSSGAPLPTQVQQQANVNAPSPITLAGYTFVPTQPSAAAVPAVVVQGQTLSANAAPITISGVPLAYSGSSIFVGGSGAPLPTQVPQQLNVSPPNPITVGGFTFIPTQPSGAAVQAVVVQGQTLTANAAPITISGVPLAYSSGSVYVGDSGVPFPTTAPQQLNVNVPNQVTVGGFTFVPIQPTGAAQAVVVQGQTLTANAAPITIAGTPLAYSSGSVYVGSSGAPVPTSPSTNLKYAQPAVIGGMTFYPAQPSAIQPTNAPIATVAGQVITQGPSGVIAIGGQTLTPGGAAVTIAGTPVSLGSSILVAGGSTIQLPPPTQAPSVFTVAGQVFTANPSGFVIGSSTLKPGSVVTISGTPISLPTSNGAPVLIIGSSTIPLPTATPPPTITINGQPITANSASQFIVAGQTLIPGGSAITVSGTPISLAPAASLLVVGSSTQMLSPTQKPLPSLTVGGQVITANSASEYLVAGQTLVPGGKAITVSGTPISLAPSASVLVLGSSTITLNTALPTLTIGDQTITANSASEYLVASQTLVPGGKAITISGTPISLAPSASVLVLGSSTITLSPALTLPTLTIGDQTITANSASEFLVAGQTLVPGGKAITVSGTLISLAPSASVLVLGSSTITLNTALPTLTIGDQTITANSASQYLVAGQTLVPGGKAITISGTPVSLAPSASVLVLGSSTITLKPQSSAGVGGLGGAILSGLGGGGGMTTTMMTTTTTTRGSGSGIVMTPSGSISKALPSSETSKPVGSMASGMVRSVRCDCWFWWLLWILMGGFIGVFWI